MQSIDSIETYRNICIWNEKRSSNLKRRDEMRQYNKTIQQKINFTL